MANDLTAYTINRDATLFDSLVSIDANQCGFVIVVDDEARVVGTLTDGDVRRALIRGTDLQSTIRESGACQESFTSLAIGQDVDDAIDIFKQGAINFLPVLDDEGRLANVLQKKQLYSLLLRCEQVSLADDFSGIDGSLVDFEVFNRPWGRYKTTVLQDTFQSKILQVKPGAKLSLQYHNHREEYWTVESGTGIAQVGESRFPLHHGSSIVIPRGCLHRLENTSETEYLVVSEVQIGDYFGEDDIVRVEDVYGRISED